MIAGRDAATPGEAKNSWLTGTAAWAALVCGMHGILGITPDYEGLRIDPCIPRTWESFRVVRRFRRPSTRSRCETPKAPVMAFAR